MIVLIDTDVLLDVALGRDPFAAPSGGVLAACERKAIRGFVSWHSLSNFYYLVSDEREARAFLRELTLFVDVAPTSTGDFHLATRLAIKDLEDAMQVAAATACGADRIITRNLRDYSRSPILAISPATLLRELT